MLAVVTGIPGTGKTTVATKVLERLKKEGKKYEFITYGDVMVEIAMAKNLVKHRDEMRSLNPEQQKEIQKLAAKKISKFGRDKNVLVDTHCTISTPKGYLPGLPEWVLQELKPNSFIIIESKPEEIAKRRESDKSRDRDTEITEEIRLHQELNRSIAAAYSVFTGATVAIIQNPQGQIEKAVDEMAEILK
jgi:adenylate kinase